MPEPMSNKVKEKGKPAKDPAAAKARVVKLKAGKPKTSWLKRLPSPKSWWQNSVTFVGEAWSELKKVAWPGRKETLGTTAVVLFLVVVVAIYLGLVDFALSRLVKYVIR